jgi:acyl-CoA-binding protein
MRILALTLATLFLDAGAAAASDDLTVVTKHTLNGKPGSNTTSYMASDHVRMAEEGSETILDLKAGVTTTLDNKKRTYYTTTKQDLEQFKVKLQEKMNDPETKKAMEMMGKMSQGMAGTMDVKKTGVTRNVAGFRCEEWAITMGELSTIKECLTSDLQYPVHAFDAYKEYGESMKNMMSGFGPVAKSGAELAEKMKAMKGFPVSTSMAITIMGQKTSVESEVVEVRKGPIPTSVWEIPAGYAKIENPMLKSLEGRGRGRS